MWILTKSKTQTLFTKLANYTGRSLPHLPPPPFARIIPPSLLLANLATSIARGNILSLRTLARQIHKDGEISNITALAVIGPHARYMVWINLNGEMPFLYGGNVLKAHVGRWSEDFPEHQGVVVYLMNGSFDEWYVLGNLFFILLYTYIFDKKKHTMSSLKRGGILRQKRFWLMQDRVCLFWRGSGSQRDQRLRLGDISWFLIDRIIKLWLFPYFIQLDTDLCMT